MDCTSFTTSLDAALHYAETYGWRVFPVGQNKKPLTAHGRSDATADATIIRDWFSHRPSALVALATGEESGVVAIDVDIRDDLDGRDSLEELGVALHPETVTAHSPSGGFHLLFKHPGGGEYIKTIASKLGPGLDVRGDGGSLTLPPGPRRFWDPHLRLGKVEIAPFPDWARIPEPEEKIVNEARVVTQQLARYGEVALDNAFEAIIGAGSGQQENTLNRTCYGIGQLVGGGVIPAALAEDTLKLAARRMPSFDRRRPWIGRDLDQKVRAAILDGMREPRRPANGR